MTASTPATVISRPPPSTPGAGCGFKTHVHRTSLSSPTPIKCVVNVPSRHAVDGVQADLGTAQRLRFQPPNCFRA